MKTAIIIDDEPKARLLLKNMIASITDKIEIVADCDDLPSGVKAIKKFHPDFVFLDIEMPGRSGLEILDYFEEAEIDFQLIFATGYSEYAIQAFKLSAIDYLLKPINPEILQTTITKLLKSEAGEKVIHYKALQQNLQPNSDYNEKCIIVNLSSSTRFIKLKNIMMLKAEGSYCEIYLESGEKLLASKNLKYFEDKLDDVSHLFRCHKSYVINLKVVNEFNKSSGVVSLINGITASISMEKTDLFFEKMEMLF